MRISDWSSDVCSADLLSNNARSPGRPLSPEGFTGRVSTSTTRGPQSMAHKYTHTGEPMPKYDAASLIANAKARAEQAELSFDLTPDAVPLPDICPALGISLDYRSEEHTSELQSLMRTSYAVFCLKKKIQN